MSISHIELDAALRDLEQRYPVTDWTADGIHLWPIIRLRIYWILAVGSASPPDHRTRWQQLRDRVVTESRMLGRHALAALTDRSRQAKPRSGAGPSAVFLSDGVSYTLCDGRFYEKFCDPIEQQLHDNGIRTFKMSPGTPLLPRHSPSQFIGARLRMLRAGSAVSSRLRSPGSGPAEFETLSAEVHERYGFRLQWATFVGEAARISAYADHFEGVLRREKADVGFVVSYYADEGFAFCKACRRLGIPSVDIQHGVQGRLHSAYAGWTRTPNTGWDVLPELFLVWSEEEASVIREWTGPIPHLHRPLVAGNLFLDLCQAGQLPAIASATERLHALRKPDAVQVLYTLNYLETPESVQKMWDVIAASRRSASPIQWWFRLHPSRLDRLSEFEQRARELRLEDTQIRLATKTPLLALLPCMDVHVTGSSSTVLEAERYGIRSVVTDQLGAEQFASRVSDGTLLYTPAKDDILPAILRQANAKKPLTSIRAEARKRIGSASLAILSLFERTPANSPVDMRAAS